MRRHSLIFAQFLLVLLLTVNSGRAEDKAPGKGNMMALNDKNME